jgi:hypothetical protein
MLEKLIEDCCVGFHHTITRKEGFPGENARFCTPDYIALFDECLKCLEKPWSLLPIYQRCKRRPAEVSKKGWILLANLLQRSRSTFSWGSFLSFFAFKEGILDTQISALGG